MGIPIKANGHWDSAALARSVDTFLRDLRRENASLREARIERHGFDCFAINPNPWPLSAIVEYQIKHGITV